MRILFLSAWFPEPPWNGSRLRVHALLRALAPRHEVTLLSFADEPTADATAPALRALCRGVHVVPLTRFDPTAWPSRWAWLSPRPRSLVATFSSAMAAAIRRTLASARFDLVIASQLACAAYAPWFGDVPALFEEVELGALHGQLSASDRRGVWRARLMWTKHCRYLRRLVLRFRACTVVSAVERELLAGVLGRDASIHLLPNGIALADYAPAAAPQPETVVFTGALRYGPNHQAMRWFLADVWPRVQRARPGARLLITGAHDDVPLPDAPNVVRTGPLADVRPVLASAWVAVAPIFAGGGTRVKILEAMAAGTPVVATAKGAEGIDAVAGTHLLIADDPQGFAEHVIAVLGAAALRDRLARAGRELVAMRYDWAILGPQFDALVRSVAAPVAGERRKS